MSLSSIKKRRIELSDDEDDHIGRLVSSQTSEYVNVNINENKIIEKSINSSIDSSIVKSIDRQVEKVNDYDIKQEVRTTRSSRSEILRAKRQSKLLNMLNNESDDESEEDDEVEQDDEEEEDDDKNDISNNQDGRNSYFFKRYNDMKQDDKKKKFISDSSGSSKYFKDNAGQYIKDEEEDKLRYDYNDDDIHDFIVDDEVDIIDSIEKEKKRDKKVNKNKKRRIIFDDDEIDSYINDKSNNVNSDNESDNADEIEDGNDEEIEEYDPSLYRRVDVLLDKRDKELNISNEIGRKFKREEAFKYYLEYLAITLCIQLKIISTNYSKSKLRDYKAASRQIENLICTTRESLISSGAWQKDCLEQLLHRPFMEYSQWPYSKSDRCRLCGKTSKNTDADNEVIFSGEHYDSARIWSANEWERVLPASLFDNQPAVSVSDFFNPNRYKNKCNHKSKSQVDDEIISKTKSKTFVILSESEDETNQLNHNLITNSSTRTDCDNDNDSNNDDKLGDRKEVIVVDSDIDSQGDSQEDSEEDSEIVETNLYKTPIRTKLKFMEPTTWWMTSYCKSKCYLYHAMLHYKYNLLIKISKKLDKYSYNIDVFLQDNGFYKYEYKRYEGLINQASSRYGNI